MDWLSIFTMSRATRTEFFLHGDAWCISNGSPMVVRGAKEHYVEQLYRSSGQPFRFVVAPGKVNPKDSPARTKHIVMAIRVLE